MVRNMDVFSFQRLCLDRKPIRFYAFLPTMIHGYLQDGSLDYRSEIVRQQLLIFFAIQAIFPTMFDCSHQEIRSMLCLPRGIPLQFFP